MTGKIKMEPGWDARAIVVACGRTPHRPGERPTHWIDAEGYLHVRDVDDKTLARIAPTAGVYVEEKMPLVPSYEELQAQIEELRTRLTLLEVK